MKTPLGAAMLGLALAASIVLAQTKPEPPRGDARKPAPPASSNATAQLLPEIAKAFHTNVKLSATTTHLVVQSDGIPKHPTGTFPNRDNPNRIQTQNYSFKIPLQPKRADSPGKLPFGPIGVAINGIPFYNPYNSQGRDAVMGPDAEIFDSCCGHPDQLGRYHYHKYPACVKSPFKDDGTGHSPVIGFAFDGFALYGLNGENGKPPADLDECNGHSDKTRGYHYHATEKFPYLIGAYRGSIDMSNFSGGPNPFGKGDSGKGPPPKGKGPPPKGKGPPPKGKGPPKP
ncbi:MAG: YHYH protein [Pedosphaera sp.]|nr:YHYH protein [Pedosphaera sp.]